MECDREEAERTREMADEKLLWKDNFSARGFAEKAQQIYPSRGNIEQTLAMIDGQVASLNRTENSASSSSSKTILEKDGYEIFQIKPDANDELVKKQYRKFALILHPDKNKAMGAESAFKLIGKALQAKQVIYESKKKKSHHQVTGTSPLSLSTSSSSSSLLSSLSSSSSSSSLWSSSSPFSSSSSFDSSSSSKRVSLNTPVSNSPPIQAAVHLFTFWTACSSCQMRYQYYRKYENQNLLCPQCRKPFIAKDLSDILKINVTHTYPPLLPVVGGIRGGLSSNIGFPCSTSNRGVAYGNPCVNSSFTVSDLRTGNSSLTMNQLDRLSTNFHHQSLNTDHCSLNVDHLLMNLNRRLVNLDHLSMDPSLLWSTNLAHGLENIDHNLENLGHLSVSGNGSSSCSCVWNKCGGEKEIYEKIGELQSARDIQRGVDKRIKVADRAQEGLANAHNLPKVKKKITGIPKSNENFISEPEEEEEEEEAQNGKASSYKSKRSAIYNGSRSDEDLLDFDVSKKVKFEIDSLSMKLSFKDVDMAKRLAELAKNAIKMHLKLQASKSTSNNSSKNSTSTVVSTNMVASNVNAISSIVSPPLPKAACVKAMKVVVDRKIHPSGRVLPSFVVPDADFHNFDEGREEKDVEVGQIWALYDEKDGLPRYYVKVKEVRSRNPFKVLIGWFELRKRSEDMGFSVTCGEFRISSNQIMDNVNSFSHIVKWEKGSSKGMVKIYPKKGEIWVIYEYWEEGQKVVKVTHGALPKYHMVEVLNDCDDEIGMNVVKLQKVKGFRTIFGFGHETVLHVSFVEMKKFSHQVPAYKMRGDEAPGLPRGCVEVDPAAIPLSLLDPDSTNGPEIGA